MSQPTAIVVQSIALRHAGIRQCNVSNVCLLASLAGLAASPLRARRRRASGALLAHFRVQLRARIATPILPLQGSCVKWTSCLRTPRSRTRETEKRETLPVSPFSCSIPGASEMKTRRAAILLDVDARHPSLPMCGWRSLSCRHRRCSRHSPITLAFDLYNANNNNNDDNNSEN